MTKRKKTVKLGSESVDGTVIDIMQCTENWNQYMLEDGSVIKIKLVATEAIRLDHRYDNEGNPIYLLTSKNVMATPVVPEELKRKQSGT